jgi:hypothetical protein
MFYPLPRGASDVVMFRPTPFYRLLVQRYFRVELFFFVERFEAFQLIIPERVCAQRYKYV